MNKNIMGVVVAAVGLVLLAIIYFSMSVSYQRQEVKLRNLIAMKQLDNTNEFDAMWKKIAQVAEVNGEQTKMIKEVIKDYVTGRGGDGGSLAKIVHEAVPTVDTSGFKTLMNIITSSRDGFKYRQKELTDFKREHDSLLDDPIGGWFLRGRQKIDIQIVTSTKTKETFKTGVDDDISIYKNKPETKK
jgi:hypothetical protein